MLVAGHYTPAASSGACSPTYYCLWPESDHDSDPSTPCFVACPDVPGTEAFNCDRVQCTELVGATWCSGNHFGDVCELACRQDSRTFVSICNENATWSFGYLAEDGPTTVAALHDSVLDATNATQYHSVFDDIEFAFGVRGLGSASLPPASETCTYKCFIDGALYDECAEEPTPGAGGVDAGCMVCDPAISRWAWTNRCGSTAECDLELSSPGITNGAAAVPVGAADAAFTLFPDAARPYHVSTTGPASRACSANVSSCVLYSVKGHVLDVADDSALANALVTFQNYLRHGDATSGSDGR